METSGFIHPRKLADAAACCAAEGAQPSGKHMLLERAGLLRREAERLEILAHALPGILPMEADRAVRDLVAASYR